MKLKSLKHQLQQKLSAFLVLEASMTNSVDPNQKGAVWSESTLLASILN